MHRTSYRKLDLESFLEMFGRRGDCHSLFCPLVLLWKELKTGLYKFCIDFALSVPNSLKYFCFSIKFMHLALTHPPTSCTCVLSPTQRISFQRYNWPKPLWTNPHNGVNECVYLLKRCSPPRLIQNSKHVIWIAEFRIVQVSLLSCLIMERENDCGVYFFQPCVFPTNWFGLFIFRGLSQHFWWLFESKCTNSCSK